jgi:hypothetical protein
MTTDKGEWKNTAHTPNEFGPGQEEEFVYSPPSLR